MVCLDVHSPFSRSWCCFDHGYDGEVGANDSSKKSTFYEGNEDFKPGSSSGSLLGSLAWKVCFYLSCFPLCYACYLTRSVKRKLSMESKIADSRNLIEHYLSYHVENSELESKSGLRNGPLTQVFIGSARGASAKQASLAFYAG